MSLYSALIILKTTSPMYLKFSINIQLDPGKVVGFIRELQAITLGQDYECGTKRYSFLFI